jgi:hypothetical protein
MGDELRRAMGLLGVSALSELGSRHLAPAEPLGRTWLESAFPLIREGYGAPAGEIGDLSLKLPGQA